MDSRRIREIEEEIRELEGKLLNCHEMDKEIIRRKINNLKDKLRRLKREEEEEDDDGDDLLTSVIGLGIGSIISSADSGGSGFDGFGGGDSGGGGFGGDW